MSKMNTEKKLVSRKLVLNREMLRTLSAQTLENVAGGHATRVPTGCCSLDVYGCTVIAARRPGSFQVTKSRDLRELEIG